MNRRTRHVALTERGHAFHGRVREILAAVLAAQLTTRSDQPGGTVRISVPVPLGRMMGGQVIAGFRARMPTVRLEIALQNHRVDLVRDRFDVALRGGELPDSGLIARRLAKVPLWIYRSPNFAGVALERMPVIAAPGDVQLLKARVPEFLPPVVIVDDRGAVADALVSGAGVGVLPAFLGEPARHRGELLRDSMAPLTHMDVHALYMPAQREDPRVRALVDVTARALRETLEN